MRKPFSIKWIYLIEKCSFDQKYKFSNKNDMVCAWRNFKNIFPRPLFTIIFRPKILFFVTYSILTGQTSTRADQSWVCHILGVNGPGHLLGRHSKNSWAEESKTTPFWSKFLWRKYSKDTFSACRLPSSFPAPLHTIRIRKHAWDLAENVIKIKFIYSEKVTKIWQNLQTCFDASK